MHVEDWPLDRIKPYPQNPRKRSKKAIEKVAASIREFGWRQPIVVDEDGVILAGHGRYYAALHLQCATAPVHQATGLTEQQKRAYRIADNRTNEESEWDADLLKFELQGLDGFDLSLSGLDEREWNGLLRGGPVEGEDEVPEPGAPCTRTGDLWLLGEHRVLCGDATSADDVTAAMGGELAECIFTSPPYAVGIDYGLYKDTIENLRKLLAPLPRLWKKILAPGGFAVVNFGDIASNREATETEGPCEYPMAVEYWPLFRSEGWRLWTRRIWCKPNARVHGPWTITTNRAATDWEHVWTWVLGGKPRDIRNGNIDRHGWFDTTSDVGVEIKKEVHGAGMAVSCARRMIWVHSRENNVVHEPFCGTGTTLIACETEHRRCYGLEIEPRYVDVIVERWQKFTGKEAILEGSDGLTFAKVRAGRQHEAEDAIKEEILR